ERRRPRRDRDKSSAGVPRRLQRGHGRRDGRHDGRAAGLRNGQQGHPDAGRDGRHRQPGEAVTVDPLSSLPIVPDTALPADVRTGSDKDKQTYQAALGFERQLLTQLTQAMVDTTQDGQDSDDSSDDDSDAGFGSTDAVTQTYN